MFSNIMKTAYNRTMHFLYRIIPACEVNIIDLFPENPTKSFHIVVAVRHLYVEFDRHDSHINTEKNIDLYRKALCLRKDEQEKDIRGYHALIEAIYKDGFDSKHPILMDLDKNVIDGTHRLAAAIYLGKKKVFARIIPRHLKPIKMNERMKMFNLSPEEETEVFNAYHRLYERLVNTDRYA